MMRSYAEERDDLQWEDGIVVMADRNKDAEIALRWCLDNRISLDELIDVRPIWGLERFRKRKKRRS